MTGLGPNLSVSLPTRMESNALRMMQKEYAADVCALVQPNSVSMGLKKTPKLYNVPHIIAEEIKQARTIIYP